MIQHFNFYFNKSPEVQSHLIHSVLYAACLIIHDVYMSICNLYFTCIYIVLSNVASRKSGEIAACLVAHEVECNDIMA